jgi:hypothetical protein
MWDFMFVECTDLKTQNMYIYIILSSDIFGYLIIEPILRPVRLFLLLSRS